MTDSQELAIGRKLDGDDLRLRERNLPLPSSALSIPPFDGMIAGRNQSTAIG
jgi:hypothetical protein